MIFTKGELNKLQKPVLGKIVEGFNNTGIKIDPKKFKKDNKTSYVNAIIKNQNGVKKFQNKKFASALFDILLFRPITELSSSRWIEHIKARGKPGAVKLMKENIECKQRLSGE